jgi:hypothetical protein
MTHALCKEVVCRNLRSSLPKPSHDRQEPAKEPSSLGNECTRRLARHPSLPSSNDEISSFVYRFYDERLAVYLFEAFSVLALDFEDHLVMKIAPRVVQNCLSCMNPVEMRRLVQTLARPGIRLGTE